MPVQTHFKLMASIPKKMGGSRCIAITATLYRILTAIDDKRLKDFEKAEAFANDSAKAGADANTAATKRALDAEVLAILGHPFCTILWDYHFLIF